MKLATSIFAAGVLASAGALTVPQQAEAGSRSFSLHAPGVHLHIGRGHYRDRYYGSRYYRPYTYSRPYAYSRPGPSRCGHWSSRCADNWGYGNRNWRGCMRYHGC